MTHSTQGAPHLYIFVHLAVYAACVCIAGCTRGPGDEGDHTSRDNTLPKEPRAVGTLSALDMAARRTVWDPEAAERASPRSEGLRPRVEQISARCDAPGVSWAPDGTKALVYPSETSARPTHMWAVWPSGSKRLEAALGPDRRLYARWSPDSRHAVVCAEGYSEGVLSIVCVSAVAEDTTSWGLKIRHVPVKGRQWIMSPFTSDSATLFLPTMELPGELWKVTVPALECSLLYTQPTPTTPRGLGLDKPFALQQFLPSPDGHLVAFMSYPPANWSADCVCVADIRSGRARLVTWEEERPGNYSRYHHTPVEWRGDSAIVFERYVPSGVQRFLLSLPVDLWGDDP